ncbi:Maf-like protein [Pararhizobium antarcticum]|uniref:7-methyl-GTP pyrophosphatase n=1 Tax=Pararhizobium antarcticum TaxID=1798805 RepID=A0A657LVP6_9HYPH|nr:Maf-like protein [Pararhizobium antarcticum]OJF98433.1 septum formation inhibitor Maf [Pararhizobium antarcticum]OJG01323.1 septum formation inhibitor Maf [Rhizobium sp. 58]
MSASLILASSSPFRRMLMTNAGLTFDWQAAAIDERAIEKPLEDEGASPQDVALVLAEAKARAVGTNCPDAIVIGSDQTMSLGDRVFHKPRDQEDARDHLLSLSGHTHQLNSAVVLTQGGALLWKHVSSARLTMRSLSPAFIDRYLEHVGERALSSVGAYQLEGEGIQLFERIEGDYFTILGLPLLPLLEKLRDLRVIHA